MPTTTKSRSERVQLIHEVVAFSIDGKIDESAKTIRDVALLGSESRNGRTYTHRALHDAKRLMDGAKVYLDHREVVGGVPRSHSVRDYVGRISNTYVEGKRVRGTFTVHNESHWPTVAVAKGDPNAFGFSLDGTANVKEGKVTSVTSIASVDLVSDPATNTGLFEETTDMTLEQLREDHGDLLQELTKPLDEKIAALEAKLAAKPDAPKDTALAERVEELSKQLTAAREEAADARFEAMLHELNVTLGEEEKDVRAALRGMDIATARKLLEARAAATPATPGNPPRSTPRPRPTLDSKALSESVAAAMAAGSGDTTQHYLTKRGSC